jgi:hypothetical protein
MSIYIDVFILYPCFFYFIFMTIFIHMNVLAIERHSNIKDNYLSYLMSQELYEYSEFEVAQFENIIRHDGDQKYLEFKIFPNQKKINKGIRTEVSIDYPYQKGDVVEYSYEFLIPENKFEPDDQNRWWILGAQFHDQPNRTLNEKWDNFPSHSPVMSWVYGNIKKQHVLSFSYGTEQRHIGSISIKENKWYKIKMRIKWSSDKDGFCDVYLDNKETPVFSAYGVNMYNDYQHYFKLGMYRHPKINTQASIHIRHIDIQK